MKTRLSSKSAKPSAFSGGRGFKTANGQMGRTANGQKSISFRGPKLWNQLSSDVRLAPSLSTFKRRFKDVVEG